MPTQFGIITHNVVAMRAEPDGNSEQVSQAILGDSVILLEENNDYMRVQTADEYTGWVWGAHIAPVANGNSFWTPECVQRVIVPLTDAFVSPNSPEAGRTKLVFGTLVVEAPQAQQRSDWLQVILPVPSPSASGVVSDLAAGLHADLPSNSSLEVAASHWFVMRQALTNSRNLPNFTGASVCNIAMQFLGTPYLWGGSTSFGFDCSGFVQRIYAAFGVMLPRDAYMQINSPLGNRIPPDEPLRAGDLVFFCGNSDPLRRGITHVGMALDAKRFIHAVGKEGVVVSVLDAPDILRRYTYLGGWRCIDLAD